VESINNILEVPGPGEEFEATNPVPHGEIRQVFYQSSILGQTRRMHIYTPPGYNTSQEKYPVLYLINGGGQEDSGWSSMGRAGFIMDNLIAANKAKPMIVVMPNGTVSLPGITPAMIAREAQRTPEGNSIRVASLAKLHEAFIDDLMTKIIPYTEKNYSVLTGPDQRAVAGLSMGGQKRFAQESDVSDSLATSVCGAWVRNPASTGHSSRISNNAMRSSFAIRRTPTRW